MLERNLAVITIQIDAIICQRITMSRKGMIGTTGIITSTFTSILSQEYTTGIYHFLRQFIIIASGNNQMFRRISIAEFNGLIIILHQDKFRIIQRLGSHLLSRQLFELFFHLFLHFLNHLFRSRNQENLRINTMLSLRKQIGSNKYRITGFIRNNTYFRRTCRHINSHIV